MKKVILLFFKTIAVILGMFVAFAILVIPALFFGKPLNTQTTDSIQSSEFVDDFHHAADSSQM